MKNQDNLKAFYKEFLESTSPHPFDSRTSIYDGSVTVELSPWPSNDSIHISHIQTLAPRTGAANRLMEFLTELADKHEVVLDLVAKTTNEDLISTRQLITFYEKWGFTVDDDDFYDLDYGVEMRRHPELTGPLRVSIRGSNRRNPARRTRPVYLFCYGSNNTAQLEDRLGIPGGSRGVVQGAYAPDYQRVFRGMSRNWGGGTASLKKKKGATTYGLVVELRPQDLDKLDRYEGVRSGVYKRQKITVYTQDDEQLEAIAYVSLKKEFNPPTEEYLEAVADTISMFWEGSNGPVTADDIPIR